MTTLYTFTNGAQGANPVTPLVQSSDGNFYGTTQYGGDESFGVVFKISAGGAFTLLHSFTGVGDGEWPHGGLTIGNDGNFYGTTWYGGTYGFGTVFKINSNGALTTLYYFTSLSDRGNPTGSLALGTDGNFYGATEYGGGTLFQISTSGTMPTLNTLYHFTSGNGGQRPQAGLVQGSDGEFYGTVLFASVFKISTSGVLTNLYTFSGGDDGFQPYGTLVQGNDGYFYGTTVNGGTNGHGTVFNVSPGGSFTSLYSFTGGFDGSAPYGGLVQGRDGNFYGTTYGGGMNSLGTVFQITRGGSLTNLYSFTGSGGSYPDAGLVLGSDGNFYGTTLAGGMRNYGTVFRISSSGSFSSLYSFTGGADGGNPSATPVEGRDGNFYGTTQNGGQHGEGTIYKISAGGSFTNLYSFTGGNDGASPYAALVQGSDGNFYGTTSGGGTHSHGTLFEIGPGGSLTNLYSFTGGVDGAFPYDALVQGSDASFYGTTSSGGMGGNGTVFRLSVGLVAAPVIQTGDGNFGLKANRFGFDITGTSGSVIVVVATTNLARPIWVPLSTDTLSASAAYFSDSQWTNYAARFYRVRTQ